jgi:2-polyprenyl-3-methyl-5-hydroxy-6-metoxy-1,4-benzoquinol methylase
MLELQAVRARSAMRDRIYGETINDWLLELFVPGNRVLDIGCGTGTWGSKLRARGATELIGVEIAAAAAEVARGRYDRVLTISIEEVDEALLGGNFDTIIAADVIEHLVDPFAALGRWVEWCAPRGELVISTPNLRHFRVIRDLAARGRFDYVDAGGLMDRTHLRWFTEASLADALATAGWSVRRWGRVTTGKSGLVNRLARGHLNGFLAGQIQLVASPETG